MEIVTTHFTENNEIMTRISLVDCGLETDKFLIYNSGEECKIKPELQDTAWSINRFIERIYNMGMQGVPISFTTKEIDVGESE